MQRAGGTVWVAILTVLVLIWGLERWRNSASHRAGYGERARFVALARCLLGSDAAQLVRQPDAARRRLRLLALNTPPRASVTWIEPCVPMAEALARHAVEVERTQSLNAPETRLRESARSLSQAVARVGLAWRIRTGDPDTDMDPIADALALVGTELDFAGVLGRAEQQLSGSVAPRVSELPAAATVSTIGLEPTTIGTPDRFVAGAPLPLVAEVVRDDGGWHVETLTNEPSVVHRVSSRAVVRVDVLTSPSDDGLAPLRYLRLGDEPIEHRVSPINQPLEGAHVSIDAVPLRHTLWLAQWTPTTGAAVLEFQPGRAATAWTLGAPASAPVRVGARGSHDASQDEHVAVASQNDLVVVALTRHALDDRSVVLSTIAPNAVAHTAERLAEFPVDGTAPGVEFCVLGEQMLLLVTAAREWQVLHVTESGASVLHVVSSQPRRAFDERAAVRCNDQGMVAWGREHARRSPVVVCTRRNGVTRCASMAAPETPALDTMPMYVTRLPSGRPVAHVEWPLEFAISGEFILAAQALGPVVSVRQRALSATRWSDDRVVFDAAIRVHGQIVEGLGLYADEHRATVAMATPEGLQLVTSDDQGVTWR